MAEEQRHPGGLGHTMESQAGGQDLRPDLAGPSRRALGSRRLVWGAFAASIAVHVVFIVLYPSLAPRFRPSDNESVVPVGTQPPKGIEVVNVAEVDVAEEVEEPEEPEFEPIQERVATAAPSGAPGVPVVDFSRPGIPAAERIRPNISDRRLWAPLPEEFRQLTLEQREELAMAGRLAEWYDSIAAAAAAESAMTDWTFTDGDGGRWGVADGRLYLGSFAVPLPTFAPPPGAARERAWQWSEIARQGQSVAVQQTVRERMEAIRARRDAERARERGDTASTGR